MAFYFIPFPTNMIVIDALGTLNLQNHDDLSRHHTLRQIDKLGNRHEEQKEIRTRVNEKSKNELGHILLTPQTVSEVLGILN